MNWRNRFSKQQNAAGRRSLSSLQTKRRTKATIAKENGLQPLADWIAAFPTTGDVYAKAAEGTNEAIPDPESALQGAHEIIAETIGDEPIYRSWIRSYFANKEVTRVHFAMLKKDEKGVYEMYYDFQHPINKMVSHRIFGNESR